MKIFDSRQGWGSKVNFVDENNVLLGYDTDQDCCENAGWFISKTRCNGLNPETDEDVEGFSFDPEFFEEVSNPSEFEEGGMAIFRIVKGDEQKFIHIFNSHNGYYGHGFTFSIGDQGIREGVL